ncbi:hypothetical protein BC567DRAFT_96034 [Phyllosticta citribraziliensis]
MVLEGGLERAWWWLVEGFCLVFAYYYSRVARYIFALPSLFVSFLFKASSYAVSFSPPDPCLESGQECSCIDVGKRMRRWRGRVLRCLPWPALRLSSLS